MKAIIVDDEVHVREGIRLLALWDIFGITDIYEAVDGDEAISLIQKHKPSIIFTDMKMPNKDGISLLKWIQEQQSLTSKTIVISGYDDYQYMRKAITYGSFDYILKPIDPEILNETLEKAVTQLIEEEKKRKLSNVNPFKEAIFLEEEHSSIHEIEAFIRDNYQKEIKLQEISERFFLSREYISRKFKQVYGETISDYVLKIRIENAKVLLKNPTIKVYEISSMIGYQDDKYFRKVFKKQTGITPTEFRNQNER
ncbi:response regulator [Anaerobacillus alkaliphilus]|uniref:Response regulator n=1 Tax=Anaerobacillus alkaliphilus TaxID=1548597 RepID=A0A4V1LGD4_9BACI|nr:response regulator [Anaerobacillus alkaliphilus]RXJ00372.1 response regulator [Anaerobacillus alkaliphilus]